MKLRNLFWPLTIFVPGVIMFGIGYYSLSPVFLHVDHSLFILSLFFIFPILFLVQGLLTAYMKKNIMISLGFSMTVFIIILNLWLNSSAIVYIVAYLLVGLIGYWFVRKSFRNKNSS